MRLDKNYRKKKRRKKHQHMETKQTDKKMFPNNQQVTEKNLKGNKKKIMETTDNETQVKTYGIQKSSSKIVVCTNTIPLPLIRKNIE